MGGGASKGQGPRSRYQGRLEALDREVEVLEARSRRLTFLRSVTFLAAFGAWVLADLADAVGPGRGAALLLLGVFVLLVRQHRRVRAERRRVDGARRWAEEGLARLDRRWEALPAPEAHRDLTGHPYAADLDLYGPASLASLLGAVHTAPGCTTLDSWLLDPTDPSEVASRQEAVRELARDWAQRETTAVEGLLMQASPRVGAPSQVAFDEFLEWCRGRDVLPRWLPVAGWLLPALTLGLLLGDLVGPLSPRWWVLTLLIQAGVAFGRARRLHAQFAMASTGLPGLRRYHALLRHWEDYPARAEYLAREVERLGHGPTTSSRALRRLEQLLHLADLRLSTLYVIFAVALLWDVHVVQGVLKWRRIHGAHVEGWMEALGTLEALSALATLDADHPDWCYPELLTPDPLPRFEARALGHPLLPPDECVRNDVELGPPGTVLLVTGSNMSGKSTLLRSIGLATVLAGSGAPVCAEALRLPAVRLFTSMRVQDSLEAGVSYFMAELLRLKALLDEAPFLPGGESPREAETPSPGETPLLYLVDEILQGTNSEERQQAGRRLIRHLLRRWALGAVTTHDLDLHREAEVESSAVLVHFREQLDAAGEGLHFDYRLRSGLATTRNALRLAEKVGLTDPDPD